MAKNVKFLHVRLLPCLEMIMKQNTAFYQSDIQEDAKILDRAAAETDSDKRVLLWFSRECGTECFRERDVFLRGSGANITWMYYSAQKNERFLAYAVEVTGVENGYVIGNLYQLDFAEMCGRIAAKALPADNLLYRYEHWLLTLPSGKCPSTHAEDKYGKLLEVTTLPNDEYALQELLGDEKKLRDKNREESDFDPYIRYLHSDLIQWEKKKLMHGFNMAKASGQLFIKVELSPGIRNLVSMKDIQMMIDMLPGGYGASLQEVDGRLYAVYTGNKIPA